MFQNLWHCDILLGRLNAKIVAEIPIQHSNRYAVKPNFSCIKGLLYSLSCLAILYLFHFVPVMEYEKQGDDLSTMPILSWSRKSPQSSLIFPCYFPNKHERCRSSGRTNLKTGNIHGSRGKPNQHLVTHHYQQIDQKAPYSFVVLQTSRDLFGGIQKGRASNKTGKAGLGGWIEIPSIPQFRLFY